MLAFVDGIILAGSKTAAGDAARSDGPSDPEASRTNEYPEVCGATTIGFPVAPVDDPMVIAIGLIAANARRVKQIYTQQIVFGEAQVSKEQRNGL